MRSIRTAPGDFESETVVESSTDGTADADDADDFLAIIDGDAKFPSLHRRVVAMVSLNKGLGLSETDRLDMQHQFMFRGSCRRNTRLAFRLAARSCNQ